MKPPGKRSAHTHSTTSPQWSWLTRIVYHSIRNQYPKQKNGKREFFFETVNFPIRKSPLKINEETFRLFVNVCREAKVKLCQNNSIWWKIGRDTPNGWCHVRVDRTTGDHPGVNGASGLRFDASGKIRKMLNPFAQNFCPTFCPNRKFVDPFQF